MTKLSKKSAVGPDYWDNDTENEVPVQYPLKTHKIWFRSFCFISYYFVCFVIMNIYTYLSMLLDCICIWRSVRELVFHMFTPGLYLSSIRIKIMFNTDDKITYHFLEHNDCFVLGVSVVYFVPTQCDEHTCTSDNYLLYN